MINWERVKKLIESQHRAGKVQHTLLNDYVNHDDIDVRIEAKKLARKLGYALLPAKGGKYTVLPTKDMTLKSAY